eukprot:TRINITY_DN6936_c0_g2_i3.p4 TRINITY_DN6936_c0_g2~~TRINITY_DN6936_c0_g2_i3.p4  ORF type:complete len:166 (-),score=16.40 TRINITY_DN6936_c0_g2_i3:247-744(-)
MRSKNSALAEFENIEFALQTKDLLNNTIFMGNQLKLFYSNYQDLGARREKLNPGDEMLLGNPENYRFKQQTENNPSQQYQFNPPSSVLHISNIKQEICTEQNIINLFSRFGELQKIKLFVKDVIKCMGLIKFATTEQAYQAMAEMQGANINGRKMVLSFTRSKVN